MGSSGLAKLSCTPAQHIGMLAGSRSVGGAVMLGGAGGLLERRERQACVNVIEWEHFIALYIAQLTRDSEQC